jgi:hypothetical protein
MALLAVAQHLYPADDVGAVGAAGGPRLICSPLWWATIGIPGTFHGIFVFQHHHASDRCCKIVLGLFCLRHHIENVMHDSSSKLEVVIGLDMLFGDSHGNAP